MDCRDVEERDILEGYLLGRLTGPDRDEFESHYFECASCFAQLRTALAVQEELQHHPVVLAQPRSALFRRAWALTPALVTVTLLFVVGIWWYSAREQQPSQQVSSSPSAASPVLPEQHQPSSPSSASLETLARVEPPPYAAVVLRGAEDESQETFRQAMQFYLKRDYANAIPGLRAAVNASPQSSSFNFYLGACYLLNGQTDLAVQSFNTTVSLDDPAYSELARFYLAKAYLKKKNIRAAEGELQKTIDLHGDKEQEAAEILRQLRK